MGYLEPFHLPCQGLIDAEKEISKLEGKKAELQKQILRLRERMDSPDYAAKVPTKVQEGDAAKVMQIRIQIQTESQSCVYMRERERWKIFLWG